MAKQIYVEAVQAEEVSNSSTVKYFFIKFSLFTIFTNRIFWVGPVLPLQRDWALQYESFLHCFLRTPDQGIVNKGLYFDRLIESVENPKTWLYSTPNQQNLKAKKRRSVSASNTDLGLVSAFNAGKIRFRVNDSLVIALILHFAQAYEMHKT